MENHQFIKIIRSVLKITVLEGRLQLGTLRTMLMNLDESHVFCGSWMSIEHILLNENELDSKSKIGNQDDVVLMLCN